MHACSSSSGSSSRTSTRVGTRITRPHRLLDLTNLCIFSDLLAAYFCVFYQIHLLVTLRTLSDLFAGDFVRILIHVLLYYTNTNVTHDTLILLMIH
jgi:hypothetical protein